MLAALLRSRTKQMDRQTNGTVSNPNLQYGSAGSCNKTSRLIAHAAQFFSEEAAAAAETVHLTHRLVMRHVKNNKETNYHMQLKHTQNTHKKLP